MDSATALDIATDLHLLAKDMHDHAPNRQQQIILARMTLLSERLVKQLSEAVIA